MIKKILWGVLITGLFAFSHFSCAEQLGQIVAVVEDDVILYEELLQEASAIEQKIKATNPEQMPPRHILHRQVLERMIVEKLQRQIAEKAGMNVTDEMLTASATDIARRNNMNLQEFREQVESQGMSYPEFLGNLRSEIIINQLRAKEIGGRVKVTDQEVEHYLETQGKATEMGVQYHLGHILIAVKEGASSAEIQKAKAKVDDLVSQLRAGGDFSQLAISNSNDDNALKGGDLGWRSLNDVPTLFVDTVGKMHKGDVSEPIRSASGFHIVKVLDSRGGADGHHITKVKVRHILIKTNELVNDEEAQKRLLALRERIVSGDDFAALAKAHSDDKGSALKGGSLDWVGPGDLVKEFDDAMSKLKINELSEPVQTQFGWHLIQVLGREDKDNSDEYKKNMARDAIRKRKIEEETELWLRRLRDEAYVEIYEDRL